jgi:hypothetical protein
LQILWKNKPQSELFTILGKVLMTKLAPKQIFKKPHPKRAISTNADLFSFKTDFKLLVRSSSTLLTLGCGNAYAIKVSGAKIYAVREKNVRDD